MIDFVTGQSRRDALLMMGLTAIAPKIVQAQTASSSRLASHQVRPVAGAASSPPPLTLVSRHLQWTSIEEGIEVARDAGFPAIAWTVRPGAHIDPADVERELPRAVELTHQAGMATPMIITQIGGPDSPRAEAILATMQSLNISRYRAAAGRYDLSQPIAPQIAHLQGRLADLVALNERYGTTAMLHTHSSGHQIGGSGWDMWLAVRDLDPRYVGINFDVGHVTAKGGDGLLESLRAARDHIQAISLKDVIWRRMPKPEEGQWPWERYFVPPGEGMVNFPAIFTYLKEASFHGPFEMYYEYEVEIPGEDEPMDMLGTTIGNWDLRLPRSQFVALLRRDLRFYQELMRNAGWAV